MAEQLVLDASAAVFVASSRRGFSGLGGYTFLVPPIFWSEILSALHQAVYRGAISVDLAGAARSAVLSAPIVRSEPSSLADAAWQVADRLGWSKTYDAEYVALAQITGLRLCTRDGRLARGAAAAVRILTPTEL